ncbi:MAG: hypothetical protein KJ727_06800, partial [Acidobacteria bacterium]|nr:hypothetical protein [Acidobacteriota bacterium]
ADIRMKPGPEMEYRLIIVSVLLGRKSRGIISFARELIKKTTFLDPRRFPLAPENIRHFLSLNLEIQYNSA